MLSPELFARWTAAKRDYIDGGDRKIDKYKPTVAALEFHALAVENAGLAGGNITEAVLASAKRQQAQAHPDRHRVRHRYRSQADQGRHQGFAGRRRTSPASTETLDRIGPQLAQMQVRANAWARGDLDVLRQVVRGDLQSACQKIEKEALAFLQRPELEAEIAAAWVVAARDALDRHPISFAMLPIDKIVADPHYLARLPRSATPCTSPMSRYPDETKSKT